MRQEKHRVHILNAQRSLMVGRIAMPLYYLYRKFLRYCVPLIRDYRKRGPPNEDQDSKIFSAVFQILGVNLIGSCLFLQNKKSKNLFWQKNLSDGKHPARMLCKRCVEVRLIKRSARCKGTVTPGDHQFGMYKSIGNSIGNLL